MSIFSTDTVKRAGDWAIEQLYDSSRQYCMVCKQPAYLTRKSDNKCYCTVYDLYKTYRYNCERYERLEYMIAHSVTKHNRSKFIQFVRENCSDRILYRHNYYYSVDWFHQEFRDYLKHYYEF